MQTVSERDIHTPMFIAALFTIARTYKQPKCPLMDEWISRMWDIKNVRHTHIHTRILFNHEKEGNPALCDNMMDLEGIMPSEIRQRKINTV